MCFNPISHTFILKIDEDKREGGKGKLFSPGIEPGTFCVLDRCDNRYTTKTGTVK